MFSRSPSLVRSLAAFLAVAFVWCSGVRMSDHPGPVGESFAKAQVPDLFHAALPTGAKTPLASTQPKSIVPALLAERVGFRPLHGPALVGASLRTRQPSAPSRRTLVGTVELRI